MLKKTGDDVIKKLAGCGPVQNWIENWKTWGNIWQQREPHDTGVPIPGFHPFDLLTAMYMIAPELFHAYRQEAYFGINHINHPGFSDKPVFKTYCLIAELKTTTMVANWGVLAREKAIYVHSIRDQVKFKRITLELLRTTQSG